MSLQIQELTLNTNDEFYFYGSSVMFKSKSGDIESGVLARITDNGDTVEIMHDSYPTYGEFMPSNCIVEITDIKQGKSH